MKHAACYIPNYPRPQFVRSDFTLLDGKWDFAFDDCGVGEEQRWFDGLPKPMKITVPFAYQAEKSGISSDEFHSVVWYAKKTKLIRVDGKRIMLNFEGVDYLAKVWCNGVYIGSHTGGYCRFSFDITSAVKENGDAFIVVRAEDGNECTKPRGKQSWLDSPFGCWYLPTTGIWKSVWAEQVCPTHIKRVKMTPVESTYHIHMEYEIAGACVGRSLGVTVKYDGRVIADQTVRLVRSVHTLSVDLSNDIDAFKIHWWTPDAPNIYDVEFKLYDANGSVEDEVRSYAAFRIFKPSGNKLMLNLNPFYVRAVLEQGYWRESGLTPPDERALVKEIELAKACGFNCMRMHQKIEDERFYYYADVMGMTVFCEMPSAYEFKDVAVGNSVAEWSEAVVQNYNHPSIVAWVPVNESWGVNRLTSNACEASFTRAMYSLTKAYDCMRPVISNDGWEHTKSDIVTFHNYCQNPDEFADFYGELSEVLGGKNRVPYSNLRVPFVDGHGYEGQPVLIDEFAGIGYEKNGDGWGYGTVGSASELTARLDGLVRAIVAHHDVAGFCITQHTDVYQEINGLFDFDREPKASVEEIKRIVTAKRGD